MRGHESPCRRTKRLCGFQTLLLTASAVFLFASSDASAPLADENVAQPQRTNGDDDAPFHTYDTSRTPDNGEVAPVLPRPRSTEGHANEDGTMFNVLVAATPTVSVTRASSGEYSGSIAWQMPNAVIDTYCLEFRRCQASNEPTCASDEWSETTQAECYSWMPAHPSGDQTANPHCDSCVPGHTSHNRQMMVFKTKGDWFAVARQFMSRSDAKTNLGGTYAVKLTLAGNNCVAMLKHQYMPDHVPSTVAEKSNCVYHWKRSGWVTFAIEEHPAALRDGNCAVQKETDDYFACSIEPPVVGSNVNVPV